MIGKITRFNKNKIYFGEVPDLSDKSIDFDWLCNHLLKYPGHGHYEYIYNIKRLLKGVKKDAK